MLITILGILVLLGCGALALWLNRHESPLDEGDRFRRASELTRDWAAPAPKREQKNE